MVDGDAAWGDGHKIVRNNWLLLTKCVSFDAWNIAELIACAITDFALFAEVIWQAYWASICRGHMLRISLYLLRKYFYISTLYAVTFLAHYMTGWRSCRFIAMSCAFGLIRDRELTIYSIIYNALGQELYKNYANFKHTLSPKHRTYIFLGRYTGALSYTILCSISQWPEKFPYQKILPRLWLCFAIFLRISPDIIDLTNYHA